MVFSYYSKQKQYQKEQIVQFDKLTKTMDFNREIQVFYQPRFSFENNQIAGLEALVRFNFDDEWILPHHLIQTAESNGSIINLDYLVLKYVAIFQKQCLASFGQMPSERLTAAFINGIIHDKDCTEATRYTADRILKYSYSFFARLYNYR